MTRLLRGPWEIGRWRAALLLAIAVAAVADLVTFAAVVSVGADASGAGAARPDPLPGPDAVAVTVIQAVADDDCDAIGVLLADDAQLPTSVTRCLAGAEGTVELTDVRVEGTTTDGDLSEVTVGVAADGQDAAVVVVLRREDEGADVDGRWVVTRVRPADEA